MAATKYTYSVQNDFPNHRVNPSILTDEIKASSIVTVLDCISVSGDDCDIWFADALSSPEETALDAVVAAHNGAPYPEAVEQYEESADESQTSSTEWADKVEISTPSFPPGDYIVSWSAELKSSKISNDCEVQVLANDVVVCAGSHDTRCWLPCSGFSKVTLSGIGTIVVKMQYRKSTAAAPQVAAYIRRATLRITQA